MAELTEKGKRCLIAVAGTPFYLSMTHKKGAPKMKKDCLTDFDLLNGGISVTVVLCYGSH